MNLDDFAGHRIASFRWITTDRLDLGIQWWGNAMARYDAYKKGLANIDGLVRQ